MPTGFIYVLANSSMPGIVKVGKTTRSPSNRAVELSGVTGVATPFIVVFDQEVEDCDFVERYVHTKLAGQGTRVSGDREFFHAPVSDVVKAILEAITVCPSSAEPEERGLLTSDDKELAELQIEAPRLSPWESILDLADEHYYGLGECIQDYVEAKRLYEDAARLGSKRAYLKLGDIYLSGEGVRENKEKALAFYKEGAKVGSPYAWNSMALLFLSEGNTDNAIKCFRKFLETGEAESWRENCSTNEHLQAMFWTIFRSTIRSDGAAEQLLELSVRYRPGLIVALRQAVAYLGPPSSPAMRDVYLAVARLLSVTDLELPLHS